MVASLCTCGWHGPRAHENGGNPGTLLIDWQVQAGENLGDRTVTSAKRKQAEAGTGWSIPAIGARDYSATAPGHLQVTRRMARYSSGRLMGGGRG